MNKKYLYITLLLLFSFSCKSQNKSVAQAEECTICCEGKNIPNVIFTLTYQGFNLVADSISKKSVSNSEVTTKIKSLYTLSLKEIKEIEESVSKNYVEVIFPLTDSVAQGWFRNYVRQYLGVIDEENNKLAIITFHMGPLVLDNFCNEHYAKFKNSFVRIYSQRHGWDFVVKYDFKDKAIIPYKK